MNQERRDFLKKAGAFCGLAMIPAVLQNCSQNIPQPANQNFTLDLTDPANAALNNVGGFIYKNNLVIIRTSSTNFEAISDICTHAGCQVQYYSSQKEFYCPCHGGVYDINGKVVGGPPPAPLQKYNTSLSGNELTIS